MLAISFRAGSLYGTKKLQCEHRVHVRPTRFFALMIMTLSAALKPSVAVAAPSRLLYPSPTSMSFGNVTLGGNATEQLILTNTGNASVKIYQVKLTGAGFTVSVPPLPVSVSSGQSLSLSVSFAPAIAGSVTGSITVVSSASNSPAVVALSGTGVALRLTASPSSLGFGNVTIGSESILPMVLTNIGNTNVTISQVTTTGAGFGYTDLTLPATLAPGQNTGLSMTFSPTSAGSITGTATVVSNAQGSPTVVSLSGTGANSHSVSLSWNASGSNNVAGYNVYRGMVSGGPYTQVNSSPVTSTAYADATVSAGATYYYVGTAVDSSGDESIYSNETQAAVPSP